MVSTQKKWAVGFFALGAFSLLIFQFQNCGSSALNSSTSGTVVGTSTPSYTVAINCGSGGPYTSYESGISWQSDEYFSGGAAVLNSEIPTNAPYGDYQVYQSNRNGNISYNIPVSNGTHQVTLKFAEYYWSGAGKRIFNVTINGSQVLSNFDIFATAGGQFIALDETFSVTVTNGYIDIVAQTVKDNAQINGILIN